MRIVSIAKSEYETSEVSSQTEGSPFRERSAVKQENVGYFCCLPSSLGFGAFQDFIAKVISKESETLCSEEISPTQPNW